MDMQALRLPDLKENDPTQEFKQYRRPVADSSLLFN